MNVNNQVASWKTAKINRDLSRWDNNMDYARAVEGSANQNRVNTIMSGINAAGLIAGAAYKNGDNSSWANGLFGNTSKARKTDNSYDPQPVYDANGNRVYTNFQLTA